ncbi:SCP-related protein precursor [Danaus plexippus plexippus]|uniref:SCP-related protein n=1 Tax=Danaus plexippus plexippus TaxID=278856 RepID=A0A212EIP5_DANPL|nr:SCP-related protein precursor [Danaus plexippus plexippus]
MLARGNLTDQPAASQMNSVIWDHELAAKARKWAGKYKFSHNPDTTVVLELSCKDIRTFVNGHNNRRLMLARGNLTDQPAASQMNSVIWDHELAAKARKWAGKYKFSHNPDTTVASGRFTTGENIYKVSSTDPNYQIKMDDALEAWFEEHKDYEYGPLSKDDFDSSGPAVGHYTQMVWSNSVYIGCGVSQRTENGGKVYYVVCNYGPSGNYLGQRPYKSGSASNALKCPNNCSKPYGNRC